MAGLWSLIKDLARSNKEEDSEGELEIGLFGLRRVKDNENQVGDKKDPKNKKEKEKEDKKDEEKESFIVKQQKKLWKKIKPIAIWGGAILIVLLILLMIINTFIPFLG
ncbi:MAG: hypothetical protein LBH55_01480 [Mycoplasmataceae bacterium]|nr:hypothetical protein [Mycoplasmataceae bacterium]